jgi:hypothetical protein
VDLQQVAGCPPPSEARVGKLLAGPRPVIVRVGERDLTPQEFTELIDEMLTVRPALTRVR